MYLWAGPGTALSVAGAAWRCLVSPCQLLTIGIMQLVAACALTCRTSYPAAESWVASTCTVLDLPSFLQRVHLCVRLP
jgi:hypothetical protein